MVTGRFFSLAVNDKDNVIQEKRIFNTSIRLASLVNKPYFLCMLLHLSIRSLIACIISQHSVHDCIDNLTILFVMRYTHSISNVLFFISTLVLQSNILNGLPIYSNQNLQVWRKMKANDFGTILITTKGYYD